MAKFDFDWVDAFTTEAFGGNGCVVVHSADAISEPNRMRLVQETSLAECAYMVASARADFGVRYYLADKEIPFAGHPTIATACSLLDRGLVTLSDARANFTLEVGAGVIPIEVEETAQGLRITMTQAAPEFGPTFDAAEIANIYGLSAEHIAAPPQVVSTGTPFCITLLTDKDALRRATMDVPKLVSWRDRIGVTRADLMEPFLVTLGGETAAGDVFSRLLLAPPSLPEDPFTGSATGCMGAYLWHHGLIGRPDFTAEQGHWLGRPGTASVAVQGPPTGITAVRVGGHGRVLMRGQLAL
ncbi:MAG: PhzF family phenazine biosynthesis protein [Pseudomonadota bacterium]